MLPKYEQENAQLLNDMNSVMDEVKSIESKVVEIARLQEMFGEQVRLGLTFSHKPSGVEANSSPDNVSILFCQLVDRRHDLRFSS